MSIIKYFGLNKVKLKSLKVKMTEGVSYYYVILWLQKVIQFSRSI